MSRELTGLSSVLSLQRKIVRSDKELKAQLKRAERQKQTRSLLLILPLVCFICVMVTN